MEELPKFVLLQILFFIDDFRSLGNLSCCCQKFHSIIHKEKELRQKIWMKVLHNKGFLPNLCELWNEGIDYFEMSKKIIENKTKCQNSIKNVMTNLKDPNYMNMKAIFLGRLKIDWIKKKKNLKKKKVLLVNYSKKKKKINKWN